MLRADHQLRGHQDPFNGPILDREKLREGTYVAIMTAVGSIVMVVAATALYIIF